MIDAKRIWALLHKAPLDPGVEIPGGATDSEIAGFQARTGVIMPADLREWLKLCNGPYVQPGLFGLKRPGLDIEEILGLYPRWKEKEWIPVAGDGCGNYYVLATQKEFGDGLPVLFIDTIHSSEEPDYLAASDIGHFVIFFLENAINRPVIPEEGWPFGKEYVVKRDPNILNFRHELLPWVVDKKSRSGSDR